MLISTTKDASKSILDSKPSQRRRSKGLFQSSSLEEALVGFEAAGKMTKKLAEVQEKSVEKLSDWASDGINTAIDDVTGRMKDLMLMYTKQQKTLADHMMRNASNMRILIELEEKVKENEKEVEKLRTREKKLEKEMKRNENPGFLRKKADSDTLRSDLREFLETAKEKEKAEYDLLTMRKEMEVAKMFQFRKEMKGLFQSYNEFFDAASSIFKCQHELVELVPAISTQDVSKVKYEGGQIATEKVNQVRRSLGDSPPRTKINSRRRSAPFKII